MNGHYYAAGALRAERRSDPLKMIVILLTLWFSGYAYPLLSQSPTSVSISAGVPRKNITPDPGMTNWVTKKPYQKIIDSLYMRVLVLGDTKQKVVIISLDLVEAGESFTFEARNVVSAELGIPVDHIMVNASHNHSGPWSPVYGDRFSKVTKRDSSWRIAQDKDPYYISWKGELLKKISDAAR